MIREVNPLYAPDDKGGGRGEDGLSPNPNEIEIGTSLYTFSEKTQRYFRKDAVSAYESTRSVLVIHEPHDNADGQLRLYQGLENFFRDNPELVKNTIFLAEGYTSNQPISMQPLIEQEPHPTDDIIEATLKTFLITGYMAYEWKHQQGIPIVGTEDPLLYAYARKYFLKTVDKPKGYFFSGRIEVLEELLQKNNPTFWQQCQKGKSKGKKEIQLTDNMSLTIADELIFNLTYDAVWDFTVAARNLEMARTLYHQMKTYENPVLFLGGGHLLTRCHYLEFDIVKLLAAEYSDPVFGPFGIIPPNVAAARNLRVADILESIKVGFTYLSSVERKQEEDVSSYADLFRSQQQNYKLDHDKTQRWINRRYRKTTTVRPDPGAAAEFVRNFKAQRAEQSRTVYEHEELKSERQGWFQASSDEVQTTVQRESLWTERGINKRGHDFEQIRRANLGSNCDTIDDYVLHARTVTSMKTLDLSLPSYQNTRGIESRIRPLIDELSEFDRLDWKDIHLVRGRDFDDRYLEIGIPAKMATQTQRDKLIELQEYAQSRDVTLVIVEIP